MMTEKQHAQAQQEYARLNDANKPHISLVSHERP